jgi:hypothetical protein
MAQNSPAAFHDIITGNNMVPCTAKSTDCPNGGDIGYSAGVGYDQASGLGSVDAYNLVMEWPSSGLGNLPAPSLTAPSNGATGVALSPAFSWTTVTGNAGYRIMIAPSPADLPTNPATTTCGACTVVDTTATNSSSYTPPSALAAGTYYWQVQAIEPPSSSGTAAWSNIFSFSTTAATLPAPTLSAPANGATAVALPPAFSWTSVTGSDGYRILIATTQGALPTNPSLGTCGGGCTDGTTATAASYTPSATALSAATTYYWEVQALSSTSGVYGTWSSASSFTTASADFSLSASPSTLTIPPGAGGTSTLTLTPINNFSATPTFSCSVATALAGVTCSVGSFANNTATVTINAASTAQTYPSLPRNPPFGAWWMFTVAMFCLLLIALRRRRRGGVPVPLGNMRVAALGAVLTALLLAGLSCGGSGGGGGGGTTPPPAESGTVTVTGTSGTSTHTATISVSVS